MQKSLPYVYLVTHKTTGEFYIGYRESNKVPALIDFPSYKTSSKKVKPRFDQFYWYIVAEFFNGTDAYDFEQQLIFENWSNPLLLNQSCFYQKRRFKGDKHTEDTKQKMRKPKPYGFSEKLRKLNLGKSHTQETRDKIRQLNIGKVQSEETKLKRKQTLSTLIWINNGKVNKRIQQKDLNDYPNWAKGRCGKTNQYHISMDI